MIFAYSPYPQSLSAQDKYYLFASFLYESIERKDRMRSYQTMCDTLKKGETLVASLEILGQSERSYSLINNFVDFNSIMDKIQDADDPLIGAIIEPGVVTIEDVDT